MKRITKLKDSEISYIANNILGEVKPLKLRQKILSEFMDFYDKKFENGTLVSIPFIRKHPKVENAYMVVYETEHGDLQGLMCCGENAKEEAEKFLEQKLKELKGEV